MYKTKEKLLRLGSFHFSFVFHSVSPVSWRACFPVLVSPQSDGIQHRTLFGPPAAYRRIREEESRGQRIWGFPETPKRSTQIMCTYRFSSCLPSRVAVDIVKAALYRSEFNDLFFLGLVWREASRAPSDPEATESGSAVRPGPELAPSTWEAHLWILRLWSQCTFRFFPSCMTWSSVSSQTKMSPVLLQYLGSMLIKDLRGTESTQDACAKMRVRVVISCAVIHPT